MANDDKQRPPFVTFFQRAVEDRENSIKAGVTLFKDEDYAKVVQAGGKDSVEMPVASWLTQMKEAAANDRIPGDWPQLYTEKYKLWKAGNDYQGTTGMNLRTWPVISPAQLKNCNDIGLFTVEEVSCMTEEAMQRLGMGGRALKQRAVDYLAEAKEKGTSVTALTVIRQENEILANRNTDLEKQLNELSGRLKALEGTSTFSPAGKK